MWFDQIEIEKSCLDMKNLKTEQLRVILPNKVIIISNGNENTVEFDISDVINSVLDSNFIEFCLVHNHPGGYTRPSKYDRKVTKFLIKLCAQFKIKLIDHLIIAPDDDFNLEEKRFLTKHGGFISDFEPFENIYSFKNNGLIGG